MYLIKVSGGIIATEWAHYAQNWVTRASGKEGKIDENLYSYDEETHVVESDLFLNKSRRAIPYAVYYSETFISACCIKGICALPGYQAAVAVYDDNIKSISEQLNVEIDNCSIREVVYRGLFIDVFSSLELFLSDMLLCLVYSDDQCFDRAVSYWKVKTKVGPNAIKDIEKKVHQYFFKGVVYHRFSEIKKMFRSILDISFPDYESLNELLYTRNDIVHRCSLSGADRMTFTTISKEDVVKLIDVANSFVVDLVNEIAPKYQHTCKAISSSYFESL